MIKNYVRLDKPLIATTFNDYHVIEISREQIENINNMRYFQFGVKQWTLDLKMKDSSNVKQNKYSMLYSLGFFIESSKALKYEYFSQQAFKNFGSSFHSLIGNFQLATSFANFKKIRLSFHSLGQDFTAKVATDVVLTFSENPVTDFKNNYFSEYGYKTLRLRPEKASYTASQSQSEYLQYQLKGGASKYKRDISNSSKYVNLKWQVDAKGFEYLTAFYQYFQKTLKPFFIELHLSGLFGNELEPCMASFVPNTFKLDSVRGLTYTVSATIEVEELIKRSIASNSSAIDNFEIDAFR